MQRPAGPCGRRFPAFFCKGSIFAIGQLIPFFMKTSLGWTWFKQWKPGRDATDAATYSGCDWHRFADLPYATDGDGVAAQS